MVVLTFKVGPYRCAFPAGEVQEIVALPATTQLPGQPSILQGFLNLRGVIVPVIRMASLFSVPFHAGLYAPIIVIRNRNRELGMLVSEVDNVLAIEPWELRVLAADHAANEYAEAEFESEGRAVVLLDSARVLLAEEQLRIGELQAQVEQRLRAVGAGKS